MTRNDLRILYFTIAGLTAVVVFLRLIHQIDTAQGISLVVTATLVLVTSLYVRRTGEIAEATKEQAKASIKMATEMREQRIMASRPIITPKAFHISKADIRTFGSRDYFSHFEIYNEGNGPAIEIELCLLDKNKDGFESSRDTILRAHEPPIKFLPSSIHALKEHVTYYLVCQYKSIFAPNIWYQTWLPFVPSKSVNKGKIYIIPGELKFKEVQEKGRIKTFGGSKPK